MNFLPSLPWVEPLVTFFGAIIGIVLIALTINALSRRRANRQQVMMENFEFPLAISQLVKERYPHLSDADVSLALEQLRLFFMLCWQSNADDIALPSRVVDACWHGFILQTKSYQSFCKQAFGQYFHHTPHRLAALTPNMTNNDESESAKISLKDGARVFQAALARVEIIPNATTLTSPSVGVPMLFAIDQLLKIPDGYFYSDEILHLLSTFDWQKSRLTDIDSQGLSDSASLGCGDGSISCGSCAGSH